MLYNQDNQTVTVQNYVPDNHETHINPNKPIHVTTKKKKDRNASFYMLIISYYAD